MEYSAEHLRSLARQCRKLCGLTRSERVVAMLEKAAASFERDALLAELDPQAVLCN